MSKRLCLAVLTAVMSAASMAGIAIATPGSGVTSTPIAAGDLGGPINLNMKTNDWKLELRTKGDSDVSVVENRVAPGGTLGWHSHPGPSLVIVKSGTITFYQADDPTCTPQRYSAGQAVVEPANVIHIARNEGTVDFVVTVVRVIPDGSAPRIDQPDPGRCSF